MSFPSCKGGDPQTEHHPVLGPNTIPNRLTGAYLGT